MGTMKEAPSLKNLTQDNFGKLHDKQIESLQQLTKPHIESFNYMLGHGLATAVKNLEPVEFLMPNEIERVQISITEAHISPPAVTIGNLFANTLRVFPTECRERGCTYRGRMRAEVAWKVSTGQSGTFDRIVGEIPIMVKSSACNLAGLAPAQLVEHREEAEEFGGYFVINGIERIVRMLILPRRNYPIAISRPNWVKRGANYTEFGVQMRCVAEDETSVSNVLHYLTDGTAILSFTVKKEQFFIPVVLVMKALIDLPDKFVYDELVHGREKNSFYRGCIVNMLRIVQLENLLKKEDCLRYIGSHFRTKIEFADWLTDVEVGEYIIRKCVCIHVTDNMDKFNTLVLMTQKLFAVAKGECCVESADNPMNQELLMGGHLFLMMIKEKLESWLTSFKFTILKKAQLPIFSGGPVTATFMHEAVRQCTDITRAMEYLMSTGNLVSSSGLGLMQASGLTVVADKLNYFRYISHFRCVHRGAFFASMRTTSVRRLLPEAWGFLCPVHTPDGAPCGLMNHMTASCQAVNVVYPTNHLPSLLSKLGVVLHSSRPGAAYHKCYRTVLDGMVVGWIQADLAQNLVDQLRMMKVCGLNGVPSTMEIALIPRSKLATHYPGVYIFTTVARMVRPVQNLSLDKIEMIGTFEQVFLNISVTPKEAYPGETTHMELSSTEMLSCIASLTPFSDFNQSPRNMYQCQMGKQTMGTPVHAWNHRTDNKLYRIQTPQSPLVRPAAYDRYHLDSYPLGTNAVVAVLSYTGYDMEDAMVLNKGSFERGFGHGSVYKSEFIDLNVISGDKFGKSLIFGFPDGTPGGDGLDQDGLPPIGARLNQGQPYYSYVNVQTGVVNIVRYKAQETAIVHAVRLCGNDTGTDDLRRVSITLVIQRNPIIGDKFSSRHGQKGICSRKWPSEDMPFSESGMTPDIIFNPHGFPSRMTIGMMIESMAGKSASLHGMAHDATPFTFSENRPAIDYFGRLLTAAGYNYYGTERMYSGVDGREFEADIFQGVVYYQRLRHMISDKFQVRTTGPVDNLTHQPVKGRKRAGGIRFGEMERDGLLSHGASFLLQDRLLNCSDKSSMYMCAHCEELLSVYRARAAVSRAVASHEQQPKWTCSLCESRTGIKLITMPYVFRYLVAELAAMNIKVNLQVTDVT